MTVGDTKEMLVFVLEGCGEGMAKETFTLGSHSYMLHSHMQLSTTECLITMSTVGFSVGSYHP